MFDNGFHVSRSIRGPCMVNLQNEPIAFHLGRKAKGKDMIYERRDGARLHTNVWGIAGIKEAATKHAASEIDARTFRRAICNEMLDDSGMDLDESGETLKLAKFLSLIEI